MNLIKSMTFPLETLKNKRVEKGITQTAIAENLGISLQFYSQIERGINTLSYANALRIAEFLGCTTDELFKRDFNQHEKAGLQ